MTPSNGVPVVPGLLPIQTSSLTMRPQVGQLINNKYKLVRLLGDGGMGSVFEAQHEVLGSSVALKFLHPELARRQGLVQRFLQEARVSAKIQSVHVVRVSDVEQTPAGLPFMVMEFLKGRSLQTLYEENYRAGKRLSYEEALNFALQMLDGLEAAHEEGVVHRDLKPDNVMIVTGKRGESLVKLLDFGIAKLKINGELYKGLTRPGVIMGTPEYMAPEQVFSADTVDARADVFSCGVMIFEMLAGRRPVGGDEAHQIAAAYLSGNIAKLTDLAPHVPAALAALVHRAMAADAKDRVATVAEFREGIEPFAKGVVASKPGLSTPPPGVAAPDPANLVRPSRVPKTIPPEGEAPAVVAVSPVASSPNASSLDGVSISPVSPVDGAATDKVPEPWKGDDIAAISAKLKAATGNSNEAFGSTVEGAPFFPGATEAYQPMSAAHPHSPEALAATSAVVRPGGTDVGAAALPATASYEAMASTRASAGSPVFQHAPQQPPARSRKKGLGIGSILMIAASVAALAVGAVYAVEAVNRGGGRDDKPKTLQLPKSAKAQAQQPDAQPQPQPMPQPVPQPQPQNTQKPQPTGTMKPTATGPAPKPSTTTPPPMIPTELPFPVPPVPDFGIPGIGGPQPQPTSPPPKQDPKPGRPRLEPINNGSGTLEAPVRSPEPTRPPTTEPNKQAGTLRPPLRRPHTTTPSKPAATGEGKTASVKLDRRVLRTRIR